MEPLDGIDVDRTALYLLVYQPRAEGWPWWSALVGDAFAHVEVWWLLGDDYYVAVRPYHQYLTVDIMQGPPEGRVQEVVARRLHDSTMFPLGLKTCVSVAKAMLGIRAAWVVTPRQLHNYVAKRNGVV